MKSLNSFTRNEIIGVLVILLVLASVTGYNLSLALRRARDAQRRADVNALVNALVIYNDEFSFVPYARDGKIQACKGENFNQEIAEITATTPFSTDRFRNILEPCEWGETKFEDVLDSSHKPYLERIPQDPKANLGNSYLYLSNGRIFQVYAYLEGEAAEDGYRENIVARNLTCGNNVCNFGKSIDQVPLEKSIEEYELELFELQKQQNAP